MASDGQSSSLYNITHNIVFYNVLQIYNKIYVTIRSLILFLTENISECHVIPLPCRLLLIMVISYYLCIVIIHFEAVGLKIDPSEFLSARLVYTSRWAHNIQWPLYIIGRYIYLRHYNIGLQEYLYYTRHYSSAYYQLCTESTEKCR